MKKRFLIFAQIEYFFVFSHVNCTTISNKPSMRRPSYVFRFGTKCTKFRRQVRHFRTETKIVKQPSVKKLPIDFPWSDFDGRCSIDKLINHCLLFASSYAQYTVTSRIISKYNVLYVNCGFTLTLQFGQLYGYILLWKMGNRAVQPNRLRENPFLLHICPWL